MDEVMSSLRKMHNIERFAVEIYRAQIGVFAEEEIAARLKAAMANEREHVNGLSVLIAKLGGTPSFLGFLFQLAGKLLGLVTTFLGKSLILKTDILIEKKAVKDYGDFLQRVAYDEKTRGLIQRNLEDEKVHIQIWKESIKILKAG